MAVIYIIIIMVMRVIQSVFSKKACITLPDGIKPYVAYLAVSKVFATLFGILAMVLSSDFSGINVQGAVIAAVSGTCLAVSSFCGVKALIGGTIVLNSVFSTAGLVIPCILGIFFFNEPLSLIQVMFILILIFAVVLMVNSSSKSLKKITPRTLMYLLGSFASNGMVMFCQKLFGTLQPDGNVSMFSMLTFLIPAVELCIIYLAVGKQETEKAEKLPKSVTVYALLLAFAVFMIQQLVTLLTPVISSAVLFTFVNGGATVIAAIVGAIMYKEKITPKSAVGIMLSIGAMICIKVFETM